MLEKSQKVGDAFSFKRDFRVIQILGGLLGRHGFILITGLRLLYLFHLSQLIY